MLKNLVNKILGDPIKKEIKKHMPEVDAINALEPECSV